MKRFILPLLLLLLVGAAFAVESEPSEIVGYVKYELVAGDNTIALPMEQNFSLASEIGDLLGAESVGYFDGLTQAWTLINAFPWGGWNSDFPVASGHALWINVGESTAFYSIGELPSIEPSYELYVGDNLIMLPLNSSNMTLASLVGDNIGAGSIGFFDADSQAWSLINAFPWGGWNSDFDVSIGDPLWVNTDTPSIWPNTGLRSQEMKAKN